MAREIYITTSSSVRWLTVTDQHKLAFISEAQ